jgi:hypothetical protein
MKKLKLWINTGFCGGNYEDEIEVEDDITEEECEIEARTFLNNNIEWGYELEECEE